MRVGTLRHRVRFESVARTLDQYGAPVQDWKPMATVWASVEPLNGRELLTAQQVDPELTHGITIRHLPGLTTEMRAIHKGRVFEITQVLDRDEREIEMHLLCKESKR